MLLGTEQGFRRYWVGFQAVSGIGRSFIQQAVPDIGWEFRAVEPVLLRMSHLYDEIGYGFRHRVLLGAAQGFRRYRILVSVGILGIGWSFRR